MSCGWPACCIGIGIGIGIVEAWYGILARYVFASICKE